MSDYDNMDRFEKNSERYTAKDAIKVVFIAAILLVLVSGAAITKAGEAETNAVERETLIAFGKPAGWIADNLPFATVAEKATAPISPDEEVDSGGGFDADPAGGSANATEIPLVTKDSFDPTTFGAPAPPKKPLKKMLVTGDSMSQPLDEQMARALADGGVKVDREPHLGTGIAKTISGDWGEFAAEQAQEKYDAIVIFIGANEGFPLPRLEDGKDVDYGTVDWAVSYANRVRKILNTYKKAGSRVYWISLPTPRDAERIKIQRSVNAAVAVGVQPFRATTQLIDTVPIFTPGGKYRDSMDVGGKQTLVRKQDGIHLNGPGSEVLRDVLLDRMALHFTFTR